MSEKDLKKYAILEVKTLAEQFEHSLKNLADQFDVRASRIEERLSALEDLLKESQRHMKSIRGRCLSDEQHHILEGLVTYGPGSKL